MSVRIVCDNMQSLILAAMSVELSQARNQAGQASLWKLGPTLTLAVMMARPLTLQTSIMTMTAMCIVVTVTVIVTMVAAVRILGSWHRVCIGEGGK